MSDVTVLGIITASRIKKLSEGLNLVVGKTYLVLNEVENGIPESIKDQIRQQELDLIGAIPTDALVGEYALEGKSLFELPSDSAAFKAVSAIAEHSITP
jgi:CO dehydrogenase maturation factor